MPMGHCMAKLPNAIAPAKNTAWSCLTPKLLVCTEPTLLMPASNTPPTNAASSKIGIAEKTSAKGLELVFDVDKNVPLA